MNKQTAKNFIGKTVRGIKIEDVALVRGQWAAYFTNEDDEFVWTYLNELLGL